MRVGIYIDGFNLYYGGKFLMGGKGLPGWRWLDLRLLSENVVAARSGWSGATVTRVVYCTARIHSTSNATAQRDQDVYIKALKASNSVDVCEEGTYVSRVATAPLAKRGSSGRPVLLTSTEMFTVQDSTGADIADLRFMVKVARREEKGSDVNVASHLLIDMYEQRIDAAVVISNDGDLAFPIKHARERLPVGLLNPTKGYPAGVLNGDRSDGVGGHWWYQLSPADLVSAQLPATVGKLRKPSDW
jgi:hypothetical protein